MAKKPIIEEAWQSDFGTINVGDPVVVITEGYSHRISIRKGTYLGYILGSVSYRTDEQQKSVKVLVEKETFGWFIGDSDVRCTYLHPEVKGRYTKTMGQATLQLNRIIPLPKGSDALIEQINKLV